MKPSQLEAVSGGAIRSDVFLPDTVTNPDHPTRRIVRSVLMLSYIIVSPDNPGRPSRLLRVDLSRRLLG